MGFSLLVELRDKLADDNYKLRQVLYKHVVSGGPNHLNDPPQILFLIEIPRKNSIVFNLNGTTSRECRGVKIIQFCHLSGHI